MRHPVPKSLLLALLLGAAGFAARALPERETRLQPVRAEHEEGRFKRARALESLLARASTGRPPLSPEGIERGYDVLTYDLAFDLNPAVVALEGRVTIRLSSLRQRPLRDSARPRRRDDGPVRRTGRDARHFVLRRRRRPPDPSRPGARRRGADDARRPLGRHAALGRRPLLLDGSGQRPGRLLARRAVRRPDVLALRRRPGRQGGDDGRRHRPRRVRRRLGRPRRLRARLSGPGT